MNIRTLKTKMAKARRSLARSAGQTLREQRDDQRGALLVLNNHAGAAWGAGISDEWEGLASEIRAAVAELEEIIRVGREDRLPLEAPRPVSGYDAELRAMRR